MRSARVVSRVMRITLAGAAQLVRELPAARSSTASHWMDVGTRTSMENPQESGYYTVPAHALPWSAAPAGRVGVALLPRAGKFPFRLLRILADWRAFEKFRSKSQKSDIISPQSEEGTSWRWAISRW